MFLSYLCLTIKHETTKQEEKLYLSVGFFVVLSVGKIIIVPSFRVGTSKNENIDHHHISSLSDSTMSSALSFCFFVFFVEHKRKGSC